MDVKQKMYNYCFNVYCVIFIIQYVLCKYIVKYYITQLNTQNLKL